MSYVHRRWLIRALLGALVLAAISAPAPASAGPWTRSLGSYYAKLNAGAYFADGFRDSGGTFQKGVKYASVSPSVYGEVGIWKNLHVQAYVPYLFARNRFDDSAANVMAGRDGDDYARTSMGDTHVGVQWSSPWLSLPHALRFEAKLPLYDVDAPKGAQQPNFPAPGDGQLDYTLWASLGKSFESLPLFVFGELGYQLRTETFLVSEPDLASPTFNDTFRWFGQAGLRFLENKYLMVGTVGAWPFSPGKYTKGWANAGVDLFYPVGDDGVALELSVSQAFKVINSAQGTSVGAGVSITK